MTLESTFILVVGIYLRFQCPHRKRSYDFITGVSNEVNCPTEHKLPNDHSNTHHIRQCDRCIPTSYNQYVTNVMLTIMKLTARSSKLYWISVKDGLLDKMAGLSTRIFFIRTTEYLTMMVSTFFSHKNGW